MSFDADFILQADDPLDDVALALRPIDFRRDGRSRIFVHTVSQYTVDFPKGPLAVAGDYIEKTHTLRRGAQQLFILTRIDCIRDRLAHFYFWNDFTALNAAVGVAKENVDQMIWNCCTLGPSASHPRYLQNFESLKDG